MNSSLNVTAIVTDEVTAVEVHGVGVEGWTDHDRKGTGWSKKHPDDDVNPEIAYNLAMARALQDLANQYAQNAAEVAGFPIDVQLGCELLDTGHEASLHFFPSDTNAPDYEEVSF